MPVLYHYTTLIALESILKSNELLPSLRRSRPRDVRFGEGQYLTDIEPGAMSSTQLSQLLLNLPFGAHRFTHFVAIDVSGLDVTYGRPGVFVILNRESLSLRGRIVRAGRNAYDLSQS